MSATAVPNNPPIANRWKPGQSGNPKGLRKAAAAAQVRAQIAAHVPAIIGRLVQSAEAGDVEAARLLLEHVQL